jgi:hypothetical protein
MANKETPNRSQFRLNAASDMVVVKPNSTNDISASFIPSLISDEN